MSTAASDPSPSSDDGGSSPSAPDGAAPDGAAPDGAAVSGAPADGPAAVDETTDAPAPAVATPSTATASDPAKRAAPRRSTERTRPGLGVFVVPALLVVALGLLIVGLIVGSSAWLAASLVASVLAAVLLVVERLVQRRRAGAAARAAAAPETGPDAPVDLDGPPIDPDDPEAVWVIDGRPRFHLRDCETLQSLPAEAISRSQAVEDGFVACSLCEPGTGPSAHAR